MITFDDLKKLNQLSRENTAEMRALAEKDLQNPKLADRVKDHARTVLLFVEAQEQLEDLRDQTPYGSRPIEDAHPEFMARHQQLQQLMDESWNALVADGYVDGME